METMEEYLSPRLRHRGPLHWPRRKACRHQKRAPTQASGRHLVCPASRRPENMSQRPLCVKSLTYFTLLLGSGKEVLVLSFFINPIEAEVLTAHTFSALFL